MEVVGSAMGLDFGPSWPEVAKLSLAGGGYVRVGLFRQCYCLFNYAVTDCNDPAAAFGGFRRMCYHDDGLSALPVNIPQSDLLT